MTTSPIQRVQRLQPGETSLRERSRGGGRSGIGKKMIRHGALANSTPGGKGLDQAKIDAAYVGYHKTFHDRFRALGTAASVARRLATFARTSNVLDVEVWLQGLPKLRRWKGDKQLYKFRGGSKQISTDLYEASAEVGKQDIINDNLGLYKDRISGMADAYDNGISELVIGMLAAGVQGTALGTTYDGQNLIDTDHTVLQTGGTAQSNKVTGALSETTYNQGWNKYLGFLDENGMPINVAGRQMNLVVGPANRQAARDIINQETQSTGEQNMDRGTANLIVTPWLTARTIDVNGVSVTITGNEWFLMPEGSAAIVVHEKQLPEFMSVEEGEYVFRMGKYLYGIECEFGAGYGLWQEVVGGPGT